MIKNCIECGKAFEATANKQYCSDACYVEARKRRYRELYRLKKSGDIITKNCKWCNKEFELNGYQMYCSPECFINSKNFEQRKKYRNFKPRYLEYVKKWRDKPENKEKIKNAIKAWRNKNTNKEKYKEYTRRNHKSDKKFKNVKEYQHWYYLNVTKVKRDERKTKK